MTMLWGRIMGCRVIWFMTVICLTYTVSLMQVTVSLIAHARIMRRTDLADGTVIIVGHGCIVLCAMRAHYTHTHLQCTHAYFLRLVGVTLMFIDVTLMFIDVR